MEEKTKIGFNEDQYKTAKKHEDTLKVSFDEMLQKATAALGGDFVDDYQKLAENPNEYVVQKFWELYGQNEPPHIDREAFMLSKIKFDKTVFNDCSRTVRECKGLLRELAPTINKKSIKYNVSEEPFNFYLNPEKKDEYEAVVAFLEAGRVLKDKYQSKYCSDTCLVKFHPWIHKPIGGYFPAPKAYEFAK
ncbi:MAG: hypothetical protein AAF717_22785 [Bacteroidota bacterium]